MARAAIALVTVLSSHLTRERPAALRAVFSPGGGAAAAVVAALDGARGEVRVAIYAFTRAELAAAVIRAHARGVNVVVKMDRQNAAAPRSAWTSLRKAGVPVMLSTGPGNLHHKFAVIDGCLVITGSYNWIERAETVNHENLVMLDEPALARGFVAEWERIPADDRPPCGEHPAGRAAP